MGAEDAGVVVQSKGGLCTEVLAGEHSLIVDEPQELGGTDSGPTPYGYLLAALGSCTAEALSRCDRALTPRIPLTYSAGT